MQVEMRDDLTLAIRPENTAEMAYLRSFVGGIIEMETPQPFTMNVEVLTLKKKADDAPEVAGTTEKAN